MALYEFQSIDPSFPITFHTYHSYTWNRAHWHENIELLNITAGSARAVVGNEEIYVTSGDTIVINTHAMHQLYTASTVEYHCLIIDIKFLEQFGITLTEYLPELKITDSKINSIFQDMKELSVSEPMCFETEMCACALKIISLIIRNHSVVQNPGKAKYSYVKTNMIKEAIRYMKKNMDSSITLEDISNHLGFNKYYLCRTFKEITGVSIIKMLNFLRCNEAKRLIITSGHTINEIASNCGYSNMSYFTKTYKSIIGCLPSETKRNCYKEHSRKPKPTS